MKRSIFVFVVFVVFVAVVGGIPRAAHSTGSPHTSTLIGWSKDARYLATLERSEEPEFAVEVKAIRKTKAVLVLVIGATQEDCEIYRSNWRARREKIQYGCKVLKASPDAEPEKIFRRVGPKHRALQRFKLQPVKKQWRRNYQALGLRFERAGRQKFKHRGRALSWRIVLAQKKEKQGARIRASGRPG